ncbi:MAG: hypothetical protein QM733_03505 [Ilumatobacteraceae bacterium]
MAEDQWSILAVIDERPVLLVDADRALLAGRFGGEHVKSATAELGPAAQLGREGAENLTDTLGVIQ